MALWDSFLNTIEGAGKKALGAITGGFSGVSGGATALGQSVASAGTSLAVGQATQGILPAHRDSWKQNYAKRYSKSLLRISHLMLL
jgi:hypothetical protein